jgi:hypothetical protein
MARLVRAIRHPTDLDQMARTNRAMTLFRRHGTLVRVVGIRLSCDRGDIAFAAAISRAAQRRFPV